jgi:hypothetical protein
MTSSILTDIRLLNRLKLADTAALDGAISNIRLWTIGWKGTNVSDSFIPKKSMIEKVRNILAQNVGGGVMDLVWGPELTFTESKSEVYKFLGPEKYTATLDAIYDGLGIPPTLRSGGGSTNTNNFMSLKTLVERLNYGRDVLTEFWTKELQMVQKALGIPKAPIVTFQSGSWSDETGEKKLLVELADRNMITDDRVRDRFGVSSEIEATKLRKQENARGKNLPDKASPFHTAEKTHEYKKIALTSGSVTPSELGVELEDRKPGEVPVIDKQIKMKKQQAAGLKPKAKAKGTSKGRPKNVAETKKRKPKPKDIKTLSSKAELESFSSKFLWANDAQVSISEILVPKILTEYGKPNVRSLTKAQAAELEKIKTEILFSMSSFSPINQQIVYNTLEVKQELTAEAKEIIKGFIDSFRTSNKREPTIDETRQIYSTTFALIN